MKIGRQLKSRVFLLHIRHINFIFSIFIWLWLLHRAIHWWITRGHIFPNRGYTNNCLFKKKVFINFYRAWQEFSLIMTISFPWSLFFLQNFWSRAQYLVDGFCPISRIVGWIIFNIFLDYLHTCLNRELSVIMLSFLWTKVEMFPRLFVNRYHRSLLETLFYLKILSK